MKHSEAVSRLEKTFGLDREGQPDPIAILAFCTDVLGMAPPIIEEKSFKIEQNGTMTYEVREWENG